MKSKAELMALAYKELPGFLEEAKHRDPKLLIPKLKKIPEVVDLLILRYEVSENDEKYSVLAKLRISGQPPGGRWYGGACVLCAPDYDPECIFENTTREIGLFLKFFTEYLFFDVLSREGIKVSEWNNWDEKLLRLRK